MTLDHRPSEPHEISRLVIARRIGARDLANWVTAELKGYPTTVDEIPAYRSYSGAGYTLHFLGPFGSSCTYEASAIDLPESLRTTTSDERHREPVAELDALAHGGGDPAMQMPAVWVGELRRMGEEGKAIRVQMMTLASASRTLPRTHIQGVLDRIRTAALELLLDLEGADAHAGEPDGPTVDTNEELRVVAQNFTYNIFGEGAQVNHIDHSQAAIASSGTAIQLAEGDIAGLIDLAKKLLDAPGVEALEQAIDKDGGQPGDNTRSFLDKVKAGTFTLLAGITTNGAYDGLVAGVHQVAPNFS